LAYDGLISYTTLSLLLNSNSLFILSLSLGVTMFLWYSIVHSDLYLQMSFPAFGEKSSVYALFHISEQNVIKHTENYF